MDRLPQAVGSPAEAFGVDPPVGSGLQRVGRGALRPLGAGFFSWIGVLAAVHVLARIAWSEEAAVPENVQVSFLAKVAQYDKHFSARARPRVQIRVLVRKQSADSEYVAKNVLRALGEVPRVDGLEHDDKLLEFSTPAALAETCRRERVAILYVTPGFGDQVLPIAQALRGVDVLTMTAMPAYVRAGVVLGIDLVSGRPKLMANLAQAKAQNVAFSADVLRFMTIVP